MKTSRIAIVLCLVLSWTLALPAIAGEVKPSPFAEVKVTSTRVEWVPAVDAERWVLTVSGPGDFFLRRRFEAGKTPFLSLVDTEGDRLPDGSYSWELQGIPEREAATPEQPARPRETAKSFNAPRTSELELSGRLLIKDGSFVAAPPNGRTDSPEPPLHNVPLKLQSSGPFANDGNACIGDECNNLSDANFSALKLRSTLPHLYFDDVELPCEGCPTGSPHDWAVLINQNSTNQFAVSEFVDDVLTSTPLTLRGGAPDNSLFIDASGKLGVGTSTPATRLDVKINELGQAVARLQNSNPAGYSGTEYLDNTGNVDLFFGVDNANSTARLNSINNNPIVLLTNSAERMRITSGGKVGIGTTSPAKKLTVKNDTANDNVVEIQNSSASNTVIFRIFETTAGDGLLSLFDYTGTEAARFTSVSGGKLALGCNAPEHRLDLGNVPGAACSSATSRSFIDAGSTTFTASSSRTLKENLAAIHVPDILDRISQVEVYNYDFINGPKDKMGLMAEDFHTSFERGSDKLLNGQEVEMALWLAVQQLTEQNKRLAAQNQEIAERLANLEAALASQHGETP